MTRDKIIWWGLLLESFLIPLSSFVSVRIFALLIIISFFTKWNFLRIFEQSKDIIAYLLILIFGLLYTEDLTTGLRVLETNFSFLAIPLIFGSIVKFEEKQLAQIFYSFILGLLVACSICLVNASLEYSHTNNVQVFFFYQLTSVIGSHPTYLAYYLIFAITFCLYLLYYEKSEFSPLIIVGIISFFFLIMILTGGQTAFIGILFVFSFFVLKFLIEERTNVSRLTFSLVIVMMICMFFISLSEQESRNSVLNDSWERFILWESAIKAIPDIFSGVGTGDYKIVLNDYYLKHNLPQYADGSYNSHNQFIQALLANGVLGVISILLLIFRPLYQALKNQNVLGVLVFFPFLIYGMTEVFLGRYQGVVFFALLHQVFISYYSSLKPPIISLKGV